MERNLHMNLRRATYLDDNLLAVNYTLPACPASLKIKPLAYPWLFSCMTPALGLHAACRLLNAPCLCCLLGSCLLDTQALVDG
jgi:hypothetical protein